MQGGRFHCINDGCNAWQCSGICFNWLLSIWIYFDLFWKQFLATRPVSRLNKTISGNNTLNEGFWWGLQLICTLHQIYDWKRNNFDLLNQDLWRVVMIIKPIISQFLPMRTCWKNTRSQSWTHSLIYGMVIKLSRYLRCHEQWTLDPFPGRLREGPSPAWSHPPQAWQETWKLSHAFNLRIPLIYWVGLCPQCDIDLKTDLMNKFDNLLYQLH